MWTDLLDDILADLMDWPGGRSIDEPRESDVFEPTTLAVIRDTFGDDPEVARLVRRATTAEWSRHDAARLYAAVGRLAAARPDDAWGRELARRAKVGQAVAKRNAEGSDEEKARVLARYDTLRAQGSSHKDAVSKLHPNKNRRDVYRRWIAARR